MAGKKIKISKASINDLKNPEVEFIWEHGIVKDIPISQIAANPWNYNEMSAEEFNMLNENVSDVGFLNPILIVPVDRIKGLPQMFRIINGEHRFEQQRLEDIETIKCVIADPERLDEKEQRRQTARQNRIRGHTNKEKFRKYVDDMISKYDVPVEDLAYEMGYTDQSEFDALVEKARDSLPSQEAKEEFDRIKDEIKTADDLKNLINKLFTKYGSTLRNNFMFLDFGGKESIWIRLEREDFQIVSKRAKECQEKEATFDSVLILLMKKLKSDKFIERFRDEIAYPTEKSMFDIDGDIDDI